MIRYLHLSDLHLTSKESKGPVEAFNQNVVTHSMVEMIRESEFEVDFVIITGDIARMGKPEEYAVCEVFCSQLMESLDLDKERLFLVPGNHDVDRSVVTSRHIKRLYQFDDQDEITEILSDPDDFPILMRKFEAFNAFSETVMGQRRFDDAAYWYSERLNRQKTNGECGINLVGLNSCLFAGYDGDEERKLALGLYQVEAALKNLEKGNLSICFFHHPFHCFHPEDKVCKNLLMNRFDLILTGHLHDPSNAFTRDAAGQALIIGAGAGFETRDSRNSFNVVEIDSETGEGNVQFYKYLPDHNRWKKDTDVNPSDDDGRFAFQIGGKGDAGKQSNRKKHDDADPSAAPYQSGIRRDDAEKFYLQRLMDRCDPLELAAIEDSCLRDAEDARTISVSDVYTTLCIKDFTRQPDEPIFEAIMGRLKGEDKKRKQGLAMDREEREEQIPIQATEAAGALQRLVVLGQPGGGKSTLVNHMAAQLARRRMGDQNALPIQG